MDEKRVALPENKYCWDPRHGEPCSRFCKECRENCPIKYWEDSEVNRQRTAEWEVRKPHV